MDRHARGLPAPARQALLLIPAGAVKAYLGALAAAARGVPGPRPEDLTGPLAWRRARAMGLDRSSASLPAAAWGGLQDSTPRSGLLSLHARADGVLPGSWEDPSLAQLWFRRADYVVPRADVGVFSRGAMPSDPEFAAVVEGIADAAVAALDGEPCPTRELVERIPWMHDGNLLRLASPSGRILLRWDASRIDAVPQPAPAIGTDDARVELARRHLHWFGPATSQDFAKWAGIPVPDARHAWAALEPELSPVDGRFLLAADREALREAAPIEGCRLLPDGDPWMRSAGGPPAPASDLPPRPRNSLKGRILLDGTVVGAWARSQRRVTLGAWSRLPARGRDTVEAEAHAMAAPLGGPVTVTWCL